LPTADANDRPDAASGADPGWVAAEPPPAAPPPSAAAPSTTGRSFQARLTLAFVLVVAASLLVVSAIVINRLDAYFRDQEQAALDARSAVVANIVSLFASSAAAASSTPVVTAGNTLNPNVVKLVGSEDVMAFLADRVALADVEIHIGGALRTSDTGVIITPATGGTFTQALTAGPGPGQAREALTAETPRWGGDGGTFGEPWGVEAILSNPYTTRASTLGTITGLLAITALGALLATLLVSGYLAARFTRPLRRLGDATRRLGAGDLTGRMPAAELETSYAEVADLARQFNVMADRLEESVDLLRRDRDRSRDFLADVSHELRTPLSALRMNTELLQGPAGSDPATRAEFLATSRQQLDRMDWLAQNLLELSKLESGLLRLDLRPDDLRSTVESAFEQAEPAGRRRGVSLELRLAPAPVRVRHDPQRIGQVVANLVGNAIKFTPGGGSVVVTLESHRDGARLEVRDTGVGIDATEIPRIFERFYRGSRANEARGSGSGLGLAIVKSIVDMHGGRISVESRVGSGTTFAVILPRDPKHAEEIQAPTPDAPPGAPRPPGRPPPPPDDPM
jgi:signal transduction histidine kinase